MKKLKVEFKKKWKSDFIKKLIVDNKNDIKKSNPDNQMFNQLQSNHFVKTPSLLLIHHSHKFHSVQIR